MAFDWVDDALYSLVAGGLPQYGGQIAWKNLKFNPVNRILWLKVINVTVTEDPATLGLNGDNSLEGFLQIGVYQAAGDGTDLSREAINAINALFKIPQRLNAPEGCMLRLTGKRAGQGGQTSLADTTTGGLEGLWDSNYISIYWLAREPR